MRVILFTGKGGVGKTSVAAATALRAAELGYRTIILSTDAAHSLSDSFDVPLGNEPRLVIPNHYVLTLALPFSNKEKISLMQSGDELSIQVANFRRNVILPGALRGLAVSEAKLEESKLRIKFHQGRSGGSK